jgi:hypothetical protein
MEHWLGSNIAVPGSSEELGDGRSLDYQRIRLRERMHRNLPELSDVRHVCGPRVRRRASIALYLN